MSGAGTLYDGYIRLTREQRAEILGMIKAFLFCQEEETKKHDPRSVIRFPAS